MKHEKKILPQYFQKILDGNKKYELRLADWECNEGDILVLQEWNPDTQKYTGRVLKKTITSCLKTKDISFWSKKDVDKYGFQILSFD